MNWCWPPWRRREDTTDQARAALATLEQRDPEVARLGKQLVEAQQKNHFSIAVHEAIARTREN